MTHAINVLPLPEDAAVGGYMDEIVTTAPRPRIELGALADQPPAEEPLHKAAPAQPQGDQGGWAAFFDKISGNPHATQAFLAAGAAMLQPAPSTAAALGRGLAAGAEGYQSSVARSEKSQFQKRQEKRSDRSLDLQERELEQSAADRAANRETQKEVARLQQQSFAPEYKLAKSLADSALAAGRITEEEYAGVVNENLQAQLDIKLGKGQVTPSQAARDTMKIFADPISGPTATKLMQEKYPGEEPKVAWMRETMRLSAQGEIDLKEERQKTGAIPTPGQARPQATPRASSIATFTSPDRGNAVIAQGVNRAIGNAAIESGQNYQSLIDGTLQQYAEQARTPAGRARIAQVLREQFAGNDEALQYLERRLGAFQ